MYPRAWLDRFSVSGRSEHYPQFYQHDIHRNPLITLWQSFKNNFLLYKKLFMFTMKNWYFEITRHFIEFFLQEALLIFGY